MSSFPKKLLNEFVEDIHKATGHGGTKATMDLIKRYGFTGEKLHEVIAEVCLRCRGCTKGKGKYGSPHRTALPVAYEPFEFVSIDTAQLTKQRKVLIYVDRATKYTEAVLLKGETADEVIVGLDTLGSRYGYPTRILADNAKTFRSKAVAEWTRNHGVIWHFVAAYEPQSNGAAERTVRSIKEGLRATLSGTRVKNKAELAKALNKVIHRLNASSKEDGSTPRDLVFAYREKCPIISAEPIHAPAGGWKGKLKEGDRVTD